MGQEVDEVGAPSLAIKKFQEFQEKKKESESSKSQRVFSQYGGQEYLRPIPEDLVTTGSEVYREYAPDGRLLKGPQPLVPQSRYAENVYHGNHTSVWGSYWKDFKWGYACCHQMVKHSVCTGEAGKRLAAASILQAPLESAKAAFPPPAALVNVDEKKDGKKDKKKKDKKKKDKKKKDKKKKKDDKRDRTEVTDADMEEYRRKRVAIGDPMRDFK